MSRRGSASTRSIGCVAAVGPGLPLAPLDLCWPVTQMHRIAGAARLGECGSPVDGAEVERDDGAGWSVLRSCRHQNGVVEVVAMQILVVVGGPP